MATLIPRAPLPQIEVQQGPQVRNTAQSDNRGAMAIASALGGAADAAADYARKQQMQNDTTAVMAARTRLGEWEAQTFDPANPEGISKYRGKNALGANEGLNPLLDARVGEINASLTPRQQQQFAGVVANFRDSFATRLNGHMDREHSAYLSAEQKAAMENIGQDAIAAGTRGDFGAQDRVLQEAIGMNRARRDAEGMGEELIKAEERGIVSTIRAQTIEGMATMRPFEAQAYFERYRDQMTPEDRAKVERTLYPVVEDAEAQAEAEAIMAGVQVQPNSARDPGQRGKPSPAIAKILDEAAAEYGVPKEYLYALAEQESSFNPNAVNPEKLDDGDNATGLFQYRATSAGGIDRKDARASARRAAREFKDRMGRGGVDFAVASHFAGEGGAAAVLQRGRAAQNPKTAQYIREVAGRAQRWAGGGPAPVVGPPPSEADALSRAQTIRDPRRRAAVSSKIREQFNLQQLATQEQDRNNTETAYTAIQRGDANQPLRQLLGADLYAWAERKGHVASLESVRRNTVQGGFIQDDAVLVESLQRMSVTDPAGFARVNLYASADKISTDSLRDLVQKQKSAKDPTKRADWATTANRIDSGLRVLGLDEAADYRDEAGNFVKKPPPDQLATRKEQRAQFGLLYREYERAFIQKTGKEPTPDQADHLMRSLIRNVSEDIPGKLGRAGSIEGFGAALPAADRAEVIADFRAAAGRDPTEAEIVKIAARFRMQQGQGAN